MNPTQIAAQANQAAQQGQQQYQSDISQANSSRASYNSQQAQATSANQSLQDYTGFMKGEGSATNLYNQGLTSAQQAMGFDPHVMATATQNLTHSQNALAALTNASQSSTGGFGLSGAQLGGYYASQAQPLSQSIGYQSNAVGNLTNLLTASQNQAKDYSSVGVAGQQATSAALNQVFQNAHAQSTQSLQNMQFYSQLAQTQGSLNAQQTAAYNQALNSYQQSQLAIAQAGQAAAQAGLFRTQTTAQNLTNTAAQQRAAYTMTPDNHGGYNFFFNGQPVTVQQYNAATGNNVNPGIGH
jgi:predicted esterase YcpF (UPF0227 family)